MYISIENKLLIRAVHIASRFAERRAVALSTLASILLVSGDDGVKVRATNLEAGVEIKIPGEVKASGAAAIPAALLMRIAASLPQEGISVLEQNGDTLLLTSGTGKLSIKTTPYEDFPGIPFPENPKNRIILKGTLLRSLLADIANCASASSVRPELASVFFSIEDGILTAVATDSFRLAEKKVTLPARSAHGSFLLPAKNAVEIAQALPEEDIIVSFDEHQCAFVSDTIMLVSRLVNATYPDYKQIIPKESVAEATVLHKDLENALKRTSIFSDSFKKIRLTFDTKKKNLVLFSHNQDTGESSEAISAKTTGETINISFNYQYLAAILSLTSAESITLISAGIGRPLIMKGFGDTSLLYLVSPMNQ